jgi:phage-related tail fiber protein
VNAFPLGRALVLAAALASAAALGAEKRLTILFTGDNGGEVAPCG